MEKVATMHYVLVEPLTYTGTATRGFTYASGQPLRPGQIVKIPLGRRSSLGVVTHVNLARPTFATKPVTEQLELPPLPHYIVQLAEWMKGYYFSSAKSVWQVMLPAGITRKRRAKNQESTFELPAQDHPLTDDQKRAFSRIIQGDKTTYLVQGVTGSGKTRLYLELAAHELQKERSAVILIPEISLTPQLLALFEASFPGRVVAYHSGLTEAQKHLAWQRTLEATEPLVVVGPRSALFLPLAQPGIIIVDECHEASYKQEQNPRYHAIPVAAKLAQLTGAKVVLGSATPSLQEVYLAEQERIELIKLEQRVNGIEMPAVHLIDMRDKVLRGKNTFLSEPLIQAVTETLAAGRQSLLFINRRGSASSQICNNCGYVSICPTCHLPLTFHADEMKLICHICNFRSTPTAVCPECHFTEFKFIGGGTKRIEAEIAKLFPEARIARLDKDSANAKELPELYRKLHSGEIDILVGTQMIAKGLDLPKLDTVGVINADTMLHMPDFSAAERTFQLLAQVAGRAGRRQQTGRVYIQTHTPDHTAIKLAARHDFWGFARNELAERKLLGYPPFRYLLKLTVSHKSMEAAQKQADELADELRQSSHIRLMGPAPAFHERAGGEYHWHLIVKAASRQYLVEIAKNVPTTWKTDLDPANLL